MQVEYILRPSLYLLSSTFHSLEIMIHLSYRFLLLISFLFWQWGSNLSSKKACIPWQRLLKLIAHLPAFCHNLKAKSIAMLSASNKLDPCNKWSEIVAPLKLSLDLFCSWSGQLPPASFCWDVRCKALYIYHVRKKSVFLNIQISLKLQTLALMITLPTIPLAEVRNNWLSYTKDLPWRREVQNRREKKEWSLFSSLTWCDQEIV